VSWCQERTSEFCVEFRKNMPVEQTRRIICSRRSLKVVEYLEGKYVQEIAQSELLNTLFSLQDVHCIG
jgi:hypothetical protein